MVTDLTTEQQINLVDVLALFQKMWTERIRCWVWTQYHVRQEAPAMTLT
jgi:hypothetical protein